MAIVPYTETPLPNQVAHPGDPALDQHLQQLLNHEIRGVAVDLTNVDPDRAMSAMRPVFDRHNIEPDVSAAVRFTADQLGGEERGLHMDALPLPLRNTTINGLHTGKGRIKLQLLDLADTFSGRYDAAPDTRNRLPLGTRELFDQGLVDDEVLNPVVHVAELAAGGLALWRLSGLRPIPHKITTLEVPRVSDAWFSSTPTRHR